MGIQANSVLGIHVHTELDRRIGIARRKLQVEALGPVADLGLDSVAGGEVTVQIEILHVHLQVAVVDQVCLCGYRCNAPTDKAQTFKHACK